MKKATAPHAGIASDARDLLLSEIEPDPQQPRRHFDDADLRILADDISRRGVLQPVLVRPPISPGHPYRLVAGERRWRAARLAGKTRIPARVREIADEDVQAAQLAENILRAGLTDIEKGRALRRLYELRKAQSYKTTWEDIANEVGLGRARINDLFSLASLPDAIAELIESGRLTGSHGIALQRAQDYLLEEDMVLLANQAARPEGKRSGGYALTVAGLRQRLQARIEHHHNLSAGAQGGPIAGGSLAERSNGHTTIRPFLKRTLEAVASGALTSDEYDLLVAALKNRRPNDQALDADTGKSIMEATSGEEDAA